MVQRIFNMKSEGDLLKLSRELITKNGRAKLYDAIQQSGLVFSYADCWTPEDLNWICHQMDGVARGLKQTDGADEPVKLVRRLQLIGALNPGLKSYITQLISRVCV